MTGAVPAAGVRELGFAGGFVKGAILCLVGLGSAFVVFILLTAEGGLVSLLVTGLVLYLFGVFLYQKIEGWAAAEVTEVIVW